MVSAHWPVATDRKEMTSNVLELMMLLSWESKGQEKCQRSVGVRQNKDTLTEITTAKL